MITVHKRTARKIVAAMSATAVIVTGTAWATAPAKATPGRCVNTPWGGFCDGLRLTRDGVFQHCEGAIGFQNCFLVRPVPADVDPRGWVPA